jgi:hypothetical protein
MSTLRSPSPADASPIETSDLKELRERLINAQTAEIAANNALTDFDSKGRSDGTSFSTLMADARAARERATIAYQEWSRAVSAFNNAPSGGTSKQVVSKTQTESQKLSDSAASPIQPSRQDDA